MKVILSILILLSIISCGGQTEQQRMKEELATEPSDTVVLSKLLGANEQENLPTETAKPEPRKKTVSLNFLTATPCNIDVILYAYENIDSMSAEAIDIFLNVFSEECNNNVEFSEFSQEMIFEVFGKYPVEVTELITKNDYNLAALTSELESPLLDPLIEPIISDIRSTGITNAKIDSIITALERGNQYLNNGN